MRVCECIRVCVGVSDCARILHGLSVSAATGVSHSGCTNYTPSHPEKSQPAANQFDDACPAYVYVCMCESLSISYVQWGVWGWLGLWCVDGHMDFFMTNERPCVTF